MQIQRKSSKNKKLVLIPVVLLLIGMGLLALYTYANSSSTEKNSRDKSLSEEPQPSESDKRLAEDLAANPDNKTKPINSSDTSTENTANPVNGKQKVTMVSSVSISNGVVYIRGGLNNLATSSGTCYATLSGPNNKKLRKDTSLLANASTTDCKTIPINQSELANGNWTAQLHYESNEAQGVSNETIFEIQ